MKNNLDYIKGLILIIIVTITYLTLGKKDFNWEYVFPEGLGKLRAIRGIAYLFFGHIYGAIIGVIVGVWFIFRK